MPDVPLLGQGQQREEKEPEIVSARTAFLCYKDEDDQWTITPDINVPVTSGRAPTADEMYSCAAIVQKDILAQQAGQATVSLQMMQAQAIAQKQAELAIQQELAKSK